MQSTSQLSRFFPLRHAARTLILCTGLGISGLTAPLHAQQAQQTAPARDFFDMEVDFIDYLLDQQLFRYANLALEQLKAAFPNEPQRVQVAEARVLLRQGRVEPVEQMLAGRNFATDTGAQALLLQLAMTYDAMGRSEEAQERYAQFLQVNQGREITDPDVLRFFAGAGMRLAAILQEAKNFADADRVLRRIMASADSEVLERKFRVMVIQNHIDHALALQGTARNAALEAATKEINEMLWGANDNYWFMAMAQRAWIQHINGQSQEALEAINALVPNARTMEVQLREAGVPLSEFPRAAMRYVQGRILFDAARSALQRGDRENARARAGQAAGQFYNAFLQYEGNDYARRSGLIFEEVRTWVQENDLGEINIDQTDPRATERIFRRQLDLAEELVRSNRMDEAENILLTALGQYPVTQYTLSALTTLSRIWIDLERDWQLMALAEYIADMYPDNSDAAGTLIRIGRRMLSTDNEFGIEAVLGAYGRYFPGQGNAPAMLFEIARRAQDRGDMDSANRFFDEVVEFHPGSAIATQVLRRRAAEALRARNFEEAVRIFEQVRDQAPPGYLRAEATLGIADAKLRSDDPELQEAGRKEMIALRDRLAPSDDSIYYRGADAERSARLLQNVRFSLAQALIRQARADGNEDLRRQALEELTAFRRDYPRSEQDSLALFSLGRLYLQMGNFQRATETFQELAREYPDTDEGRDAEFSLVRAAMEENQIEIAQNAVRRMVSQPASYTPDQIFQVGRLMLDNGRYQEALDSFALVMDSERARTEPAFRQRLLISMGRAAVGAGQAQRAIDPMEALIQDFPNSALVVDAGVILSQAFIQSTPPQIERAQSALGQVARIITHRRNAVDQAKLDLAVGEVELARGNPGAALAGFYRVGLSRPESPEHGDLVMQGIRRGIAVAQPMAEDGDTSKWGLIVDLTQQFISHFPLDRGAEAMRALNIRALGQVQ